MKTWYREIQTATDVIDRAIEMEESEQLTLSALSGVLGYSSFHMTRHFHALTGMSFRDYVRRRKLAYALRDVRDGEENILNIALRYGFSSHEAFTRAFKAVYGVTPKAYRKNPVPVVLRSKINPLDRYLLGKGEIGMIKSNETVKVYAAKVAPHRFLHIKNYESDGYFDFWEKQGAIPGQDCDTICGMLDSIKGKLDGDDRVVGQYCGQVMAFLQEADGKRPEAYGIRLPEDWKGPVPAQMLMLEISEGEYMVFEHGPFDFETQCGAVYEQLDQSIAGFDWAGSGYRLDQSPGRIAYYYNDPTRFLKRVLPVVSIQK